MDASIKKNTGFIKKLKKGLTKENKASLLKDIGEISLEKYLSEIISTIHEAILHISSKREDIDAAVEVISAMHQRFNVQFTVQFFEIFLTNFVNPEIELSEKNESFRISKLKNNLIILTELYLVHVFTSLDIVDSKEVIPFYLQRKLKRKEPFIFSILKEVLNYKFKMGYTLSLGTMFIESYPALLNPSDQSMDDFILDGNLKNMLQSLFKAFTDAVITRLKELTKTMNKLMREHKKCQIRTGKESDEYIEEHHTLLPVYEKFKTATDIFAPVFNIELPAESFNLTDEVTQDGIKASSVIVNEILPPSQRLWENEEVRLFYEKIPNIQNIVQNAEAHSKETNSDPTILSEFFSKLELAETTEEIDTLSADYWMLGLDNKATRNRLFKFFLETQDWSKLNLYARFIATNNSQMPENTEEFISYLDNGFRSQLHSNKINVKNIIFYGQMIKFKLVPKFMIFHKIRTLVLNLKVPNNVEILTIFFEHSGRFLLNNPEYRPEMAKMIELLRQMIKEGHFTMNLKSALDNILSLLFPPTVKSLNDETSEESDEQLFYRVLIRKELQNFSYKESLMLVCKAHWQNKEIYDTFFDLFSKPEKISYPNIKTLTQILNGLYLEEHNFVIKVIDQVLENIVTGLENDDFSENMKRVAQVRYLTEIFNMEMIKSNVVLDVVYQIIRYGHPNNSPNPRFLNQSDLPNNYFRIQLVTTVLLNIERFPETLKKQLEQLLRFFEFYTFTKVRPLPMSIKFEVEDVFNKYEKIIPLERSETIVESIQRFQSLVSTVPRNGPDSRGKVTNSNGASCQKPGSESNKTALADEDMEEEENDEGYISDTLDDDDDDDDDKNDSNNDSSLGEDSEDIGLTSGGESDISYDDSDSSDDSSGDSSDDTESDDDSEESDDDFGDIEADRDHELKRIYGEYENKLKSEEEQKAEEELERKFQSLMMESMDDRKSDKTNSTQNLPVISKINTPSKLDTFMDSNKTQESNTKGKIGGKVAFTFLSKSGKKTNSRVLELPSNVKFVSGVLEEETRLKNEREKIKKMVLNRTFD